jgi:two-component system, cell cycle sensor histidine kinase and response regulator CckA
MLNTVCVHAHLHFTGKEKFQAQSLETQNIMMVDSNEIMGNIEEDRADCPRERAMLDAALDAIFLINEQANIIAANRTAFKLFGYSLDELAGQSFFRLVAAKDRERVTRSLIRELVATRPAFEQKETECTGITKGGESVPVEISLQPFGGSEPAFISVVRDLTERTRAEADRRQLQDALRKSQKMNAVGQLAAGLAHDFNNLLAVIVGFSDLLLHQIPGQECAWRHKIEEIKKAAKRAAALTGQLLAFGRQQVLEPRILDLNEVVCESCKMLDGLLGSQITLTLHLSPVVGRVLADLHQLEQVIINLSLNARDAMPNGGKLIIQTADRELTEEEALNRFPMAPGPYVMIALSDTGFGMDKGTQARLFEPFFTTKALGQGTGLGLATVYGIVKQSGGFIWVESEPGKGTRFEVYFPRIERVPPLEPGAPPARFPLS